MPAGVEDYGARKVFKIHPDLETALEAARRKSQGALPQPPFTRSPTRVFSETVFEEASNHTSIVRARGRPARLLHVGARGSHSWVDMQP